MINKTKTDCETTLCYYETATRPQFFHGMLLTDEHLRDEQDYHREALKRVNRHLWGSGIVCGLTVEKKDLCIKINPGVALDCCGNLIDVCKCITLDLSKECEKQYGSDCPPRQPQGTAELTIKKYLVLRYVERPIDPQPVLTPDTDCEPAGGQSKCSASKVQEGFCIELWDKCPCPHDPGDVKTLISTLQEAADHQELGYREQAATREARMATGEASTAQSNSATEPPQKKDCIDLPLPCEDCGCCESAVGLAVLEINCTGKTIVRNIECDCRRYVMSPRLLNWLFSRVRPKTMPTNVQELYSRLGERSNANMMASGMTLEAAGARFDAAGSSIEASGETAEDLDNKIKKLNAEITGLKKLRAEAKKQTDTTPATPPTKTSGGT